MPDARILIVIPIHGQLHCLRRCLESLARHPATVPSEVLLVDDATPGGIALVADDFPWAHRLVRPEQGGFSRACNAGLRAMTEAHSHVVLLNSDAEVQAGCLDAMVGRFARSPAAGIVGGMELDPADPDRIVCGGNRPMESEGRLTDMFFLDRVGRLSDGEFQEAEALEWVSFGAVMMSRACVVRVGLLDETFVNYFSDADYCLRTREAELEVWYEPDARLLHQRHATTGLSRGHGLLRMQKDRERFCDKWKIEQTRLSFRQHRWLRWVMNGRARWRPRLIPHLLHPGQVSPDVVDRLRGRCEDPGALALAERGGQSPAGIERRDLVQAWWQLYASGLAYVEANEPLEAGEEEPDTFLDGCDLEVLAPHADDAALSVGGLLHFRAGGSDYTSVRTIFSRSGYAVPPLADLGADEVTRVRQFEEAAWCAHLGAGYAAAGFPDRLLRHPHAPIFLAGRDELELDTVAEIAELIVTLATSSPRKVFLVPLAAGLMADHAIVAAAALMAIRGGISMRRFLVYDDLPYAGTPDAVDRGTLFYREFGFELLPETFDVSRWFANKLENLAFYASQITEDMLAAVERHGQALGSTLPAEDGAPEHWRRAERLWKLAPHG